MGTLEDGIRTLFNELDENSKIIKYENVTADDNFSVVLRTKLNNNDTWSKVCDHWVERFTNQTNSKWLVKYTHPKIQRMEYRKVYVCKENKSPNKSCRGKIDIKIKKCTKSTLKKDVFLKNGYNGEIRVIFDHSHRR